jgi:16S rRNA (adenine(1408)-N(1))-methyltransferase
VTIDLGTGDGRSVLRGARAAPSRLVIGIDADAASMRTASARASHRKRGQPNAVFVVAAAERLPDELAGVADRISILFPWGSLLRGLVTGDAPIVGGIARLAAAGADVQALWSIVPRDRSTLGVDPLPDDGLVSAFHEQGLVVSSLRPATRAEALAAGSTWAKRLFGSDPHRPVTLLRATKGCRDQACVGASGEGHT